MSEQTPRQSAIERQLLGIASRFVFDNKVTDWVPEVHCQFVARAFRTLNQTEWLLALHTQGLGADYRKFGIFLRFHNQMIGSEFYGQIPIGSEKRLRRVSQTLAKPTSPEEREKQRRLEQRRMLEHARRKAIIALKGQPPGDIFAVGRRLPGSYGSNQ